MVSRRIAPMLPSRSASISPGPEHRYCNRAAAGRAGAAARNAAQVNLDECVDDSDRGVFWGLPGMDGYRAGGVGCGTSGAAAPISSRP
jgi:hypothetical protein